MKKFETSKVLVTIIAIFGMLMVVAYYGTIWLGFECDPAVAVAGITEILGSIIGYLIYQAKLKDSRNKYKVDSNGVPWFKTDEELFNESECKSEDEEVDE